MKDKRLHRLQVVVRVLDIVANRVLVLNTIDEERWTFSCESEPALFCFIFKCNSFDNARMQAKLMYWAWCLEAKEIKEGCSPSEFLQHRPTL